jgi:hypothetical protein
MTKAHELKTQLTDHIYVLAGYWCPADCGSDVLYYATPAYGSSQNYRVWCVNCFEVVENPL